VSAKDPQEDGKTGSFSGWFSGQPTKPGFDDRNVEVDEERGVQVGELQIGNHLRLVNREKLFNGFDLEDDPAINDEVDSITTVEKHAFVLKSERALVLERKPTKREFTSQTRLVSGLQKSRPKMAVDFDARADDLL